MSTIFHMLRASCILLFIIPQIICEWVEIEQDNYKPRRKLPISTGHEFQNKIRPLYEETTKSNRIYINQTLDKQWNKGVVDRVANTGSIRRVHVPSVKTPSITSSHGDNEFTKTTPSIKEAAINSFKYRQRINIPQRQHPTDRPIVLKVKPNLGEDFRINENKITEAGDKITPNDTDYNVKNSIKKIPSIKKTQNFDREVLVTAVPKIRINQMQTFNDHLSDSETNKHLVVDENENDADINEQSFLNGQRKPSANPNIFHSETTTTTKKIKIIHQTEIIDNAVSVPKIKSRTNNNLKKRPSNIPLQFLADIVSGVPVNEEEVDSSSETVTEEVPIPNSEDIIKTKKKITMSGILNFMKVISETIYKNTHRSFKSKVKYLEGLKNSILTTIEENIDSIWPDEEKRKRREARGQLEFPSSEGSLMTISFLTFAVFLIKLVLQVIHTYKNKTMMVAPTMVAAMGRVARAIRSHQ